MISLARQLLSIGSLFLLGCTLQAQTDNNPVGAPRAREVLPALNAWFLSTGSWGEDPQLYVREVGYGSTTIVMLHGGWGAEHSGLVDAVRGLEDQYRFIFYDQRGSLRSPFPDSLISFDHHIQDLELLRRELRLDRLNIVGHSMGAILASAYAWKYPHRVERLTLVAPAYLKHPIPAADSTVYNEQLRSSEAFMGRQEVTQELEKYSLAEGNRALTSREETVRFRINFASRMLFDVSKWPDMIGGRALYNSRVFPLTARTYPEAGWDFPQEFKDHTYPVGIIMGDHDFLDIGNHLVRRWTGDIPRMELSIIENAGHIIWIDQPEIFASELRKHLSGGYTATER